MTLKERENRFVKECRKDFGVLTWESELLLRYAFSRGAQEVGRVAYAGGMAEQRSRVLEALGAVATKEEGPLP